ncbi:MAG: toll/interleukin-1 receptor domain-containing protein [Rhodospirillaceae bacterium]
MPHATTTDVHDVFISYRNHPSSADTVTALKEALEARGLSVWVDSANVMPLGDLRADLHEGLKTSRALLAVYCADYAGRRVCQWELTAALLAGAHEVFAAPDPAAVRGRRLMVVTPGTNRGHIRPHSLGGLHVGVVSPLTVEALADAVAARLHGVKTPMGTIPQTRPIITVGLDEHNRSPRFVGRLREMWDIFDALSGDVVFLRPEAAAAPGSDGVGRLHGSGGVGKSLLALEYAHRYAPFYPRGVFWISAARQSPDWLNHVRTGLRAPAKALDVNLLAHDAAARDMAPKDALAALRRMLAEALGAEADAPPYLWVVDDLPEDADPAERNAWTAPTDAGRTLFTTRNGGLRDLGITIPVGMLETDEGVDLLTGGEGAADAIEAADIDGFLKAVDYYPLAVDVGGQLVLHGHFTSYADLRQVAENPKEDKLIMEVAEGLRLDLPNGYQSNIVATLLKSFDHVHSRCGEAALDILRLAAVLAHNQPIPHDLMAEILDGEHRASRSALVQSALATVTEAGVTVHPVICRAIALSSGAATLARLKAQAVTVLTQRMKAAADIRRHNELASLLPHVQALTATPDTAEEADLLSWLGRLYMEAGQAAQAKPLFRLTSEVQRRILGAEHSDTLTSMNNLAVTLLAEGDHAGALMLQEEALELQHRILGTEHPDTFISMNNLAATLEAQGDHVRAQVLHEQVLEVRRRVLGAEHPDTLTSMNNLAGTLGAQGNHAGARALQEKVLEVRRRILGAEHTAALNSMSNLAFTLWAQGDHAGARALQEEVLEVQRRTLGAEHPVTLTSMNNLAATLGSQGEHAGARVLEEESLEVRRRVLGAKHPATLNSMANLAATLWEQGDHAGARVLEDESLEVRRRVLGAEHPATLTSMNNLAATLGSQGDHAGARVLQEQVLEVRCRILGAEHPDTLASMANLGVTLLEAGDLQGVSLLLEALEGYKRVMPDHPDTRQLEALLALLAG